MRRVFLNWRLFLCKISTLRTLLSSRIVCCLCQGLSYPLLSMLLLHYLMARASFLSSLLQRIQVVQGLFRLYSLPFRTSASLNAVSIYSFFWWPDILMTTLRLPGRRCGDSHIDCNCCWRRFLACPDRNSVGPLLETRQQQDWLHRIRGRGRIRAPSSVIVAWAHQCCHAGHHSW